jgi:hypothetical protein
MVPEGIEWASPSQIARLYLWSAYRCGLAFIGSQGHIYNRRSQAGGAIATVHPLTMRISKTIKQKLSDLEGQIFLLANALNGLNAGEGDHLRHLAAELRVLICKSSGTEGLLWRLVDDLGVVDDVRLHSFGNVNPEHPLWRDLRYWFMPLYSPGYGDPRLPIVASSLRKLIKTHEAVFAAGRGITHEQLIKWVSQQMGSAHEDDAIQPILAELNAIRIAHIQPFFYVLHSDAVLVIDVAERVLQKGAMDVVYQRRHPSFSAGPLQRTIPVNMPLSAPALDAPFDVETESVIFSLNSEPKSWGPGKTIKFPPYKMGPLTFQATKTPDGFLELKITGLFVQNFLCRKPLPKIDQRGLSIGVTGRRPKIDVYFNGMLVETLVANGVVGR